MIYIAFLQGINVGKHNRIKMENLKHLFESRGLKKVQTYKQNGNVLFESDLEEAFLSRMIEREIKIIYNYVVPVIIRTDIELKQIIKNCPYSKDKIHEAQLKTGERPYVSFMKYEVSSENMEILNQYNREENEFHIIGRNIYLLFSQTTFRNSTLVRNLHRIDIHAIVRNWNTIKKLVNLTKSINN